MTLLPCFTFIPKTGISFYCKLWLVCKQNFSKQVSNHTRVKVSVANKFETAQRWLPLRICQLCAVYSYTAAAAATRFLTMYQHMHAFAITSLWITARQLQRCEESERSYQLLDRSHQKSLLFFLSLSCNFRPIHVVTNLCMTCFQHVKMVNWKNSIPPCKTVIAEKLSVRS